MGIGYGRSSSPSVRDSGRATPAPVSLPVRTTPEADAHWVFGLAHLALLTRPKSRFAGTTLTVAAGVALSWALAIWLLLRPQPGVLLRVLVAPLGLGTVASLLGFSTSNALWLLVLRRTTQVATDR